MSAFVTIHCPPVTL